MQSFIHVYANASAEGASEFFFAKKSIKTPTFEKKSIKKYGSKKKY